MPAIAWWPGHIPAGAESSSPAISIDVMPTMLSLAGVDTLDNHVLDGVDLAPVLLYQDLLSSRPLFWASLSNNGMRSEAMRQGSWKLVILHPKSKPGAFENERIELYRLDQDPSEKKDLCQWSV